MFVAHLPAGYIVARYLAPRLSPAIGLKTAVFAGMLGAIAPDFDLFYAYLIDHGQRHHHRYWTHWPLTWIALLMLIAVGWRRFRHSALVAAALVFALNGFGHTLLDSIVGDIWWLYPMVGRPYSLFHVANRYEPWWINFIANPSFLLELAILAYAWHLWRRPTAH